MPEVENKTVVGRAEFGNKRDVEEFVTGMKDRTGNRYGFRVRKVHLIGDTGRDTCLYEVEWFEA